MNLEEVRAFLEQNKDNSEVREFVEGLNPITVDKVKDLTTTNDEMKRWLESQKDSHFSTSLETWKKNNLDDLVLGKVKEMYPEETEEQKRIKILEQKLAEKDKAAALEAIKNKALTTASEKGLPTKLIDVLLREDEEQTLSNLALLEETFQPYIESKVEERFKDSGRKPPRSSEEKLSVGEKFAAANNQGTTQTKTLWD